jgi:hypothetical protein
MNNEYRREIRASLANASTSTLPGLELLNLKLVFGTARFCPKSSTNGKAPDECLLMAHNGRATRADDNVCFEGKNGHDAETKSAHDPTRTFPSRSSFIL